MKLRVLGVKLGFENSSVRTEEGVLQDMPSNEEAGQSKGLTSTSNKVMIRF